MVGRPLGGALFGVDRAIPFLFDTFTYAVSLITLLCIRKEFQAERPPGKGRVRRHEITAGIAWIWRQPFLRTTTFLISGSNLLFQALFLALIVIMTGNSAPPSTVGLIFGIAATGGVLGSVAAPAFTRRLSMRMVVIGTNWAWALLVPLVLVVRQPYLLGAVYALMCFIGPVWNVTIAAYQQAITPDRIRGRVVGAVGMVAYGGVPLGSFIGGLLLGSVGVNPTVWVLAIWMLLLAVVATVNPAVRDAPRAKPPARRPMSTV
jgi:predicted MFS family arabinose efflux permease